MPVVPRGLGMVLAAVIASVSGEARADPIVGEGSADIDPEKGMARARSNALSRARKAALDLALSGLAGPIDKAARKSVRKHSEAWTGAYRILSQSTEGGKVALRVEVDIDTVRLGKRVAVAKTRTDASAYGLGAVELDDACAALDAGFIGDELGALGAVSDKGSTAATIEVRCEDRGRVRYTHMHAARVHVVARTEAGVLVEAKSDGFGADADQAMHSGLQSGLERVGTAMRQHREGRIRVRIEAPLPAARVRRLETAMRNSVAGVDAVSVAGIEPGVAILAVDGELSVKQLARRLETLRLPGFGVTIARDDEPDVLTIRLD